MKKILSIIMTVLMALCLMSGCSKKDTEIIVNYANEIKTIADELSPYIMEGFNKGYIDEAGLDEFNAIVERLDEIIAEPENSDEIMSELDSIKENLSVMASQAAAPNEIIDSIINVDKPIETTTEESTENRSENVSENMNGNESQNTEVKKPLSNDISKLIDDYTVFQNAMSREVEKGAVSEEEYLSLLQAGTNLATLKEEMEDKGESDELNARVNECKKQIYDFAVKIGYDLADKFK